MIIPINVTYASSYYTAQSYYVWDQLMTSSGRWGSNNAVLFSEGCDVNGKTDCRAACDDPQIVWNAAGSIFTLHNCMVWIPSFTSSQQSLCSHLHIRCILS